MVTTICAEAQGNIFLHLALFACRHLPQNESIAIRNRFPAMTPRRLILPLLLAGLLGMQDSAWAQARWRDLSREERREMREQMREHWRHERGQRGDDGGPRRWGEMAPEDRRRIREELREQRGSHYPAGDRHEPMNERPGRAWRRE